MGSLVKISDYRSRAENLMIEARMDYDNYINFSLPDSVTETISYMFPDSEIIIITNEHEESDKED